MADIYISSTFEDLKKERKATARAVQQLGHSTTAMKNYVASDKRTLDKCLDDVQCSDVYNILGDRPGNSINTHFQPDSCQNPPGPKQSAGRTGHVTGFKGDASIFRFNRSTIFFYASHFCFQAAFL